MKLERLLKLSILVSMLIALVYLMPPIVMPFSGIPITLQTWMVLMIGLLLKPKEAFFAVMSYVILGALGLPIFSGQKGGMSVILGPTGGFIVGFPLVSMFVAIFKQKQSAIIKNTLISILFMIIVLYAFAALWFVSYLNMTYLNALYVLLPFVPFDLAKVLFANLIYQKLPLQLLNTQTVRTKEKKYE